MLSLYICTASVSLENAFIIFSKDIAIFAILRAYLSYEVELDLEAYCNTDS